MAYGMSNIFEQSARRRRNAKRRYEAGWKAKEDARRAADAFNRSSGGKGPQKFAFGHETFTTPAVTKYNPATGRREPTGLYMSPSAALRANEEFFRVREAEGKARDEAVEKEYVTAASQDEALNREALHLFAQGAGHRRNKFVRRLYRQWLSTQRRQPDVAEGGTQDAQSGTETPVASRRDAFHAYALQREAERQREYDELNRKYPLTVGYNAWVQQQAEEREPGKKEEKKEEKAAVLGGRTRRKGRRRWPLRKR